MTRKKRTLKMIVIGEMIVLLALAGALTLMASTLSAKDSPATRLPGDSASRLLGGLATRLR